MLAVMRTRLHSLAAFEKEGKIFIHQGKTRKTETSLATNLQDRLLAGAAEALS